MQWLGLAILLGILITLFLAARYFGDTQKTHNARPKSARDDFYHSRGMINVSNAREKLDEIAVEQRRRSSPRRH
jgi:hypothetical protein